MKLIRGVAGIDVCTVAFNASQLEVTLDVVMPGTLDRLQQLLNVRDSLGPFNPSDVNVRTTKTRGMGYFPFPVLAPSWACTSPPDKPSSWWCQC
jgi:hypothetical protein